MILIGNLGTDPEVKHFENGTSVARFRLATNESYRVKVGDVWETREQEEWHTVNAWRGLATLSERYLKKGRRVYVEGRLRSRKWEKDGIERTSTEVEAVELILLDRPTDRAEGGAPMSAQPQRQQEAAGAPMTAAPAAGPDELDDLPF